MTDPIEAERIVLGSAMISEGDSISASSLDPAEFSRVPHRELWALLVRRSSEGQPVSPVALLDALIGDPITGISGDYLHTLFASVPTVANVDYYAAIVRDQADLRAIHAAGQRMVQATTISDGQTAKTHARQTLDSMDRRDSGNGARDIGDLVVDVLQRIENGTAPGLTTPWPDIDRMLGGLRPGTSTVVAARPGLGKSILGVQLAVHVAAKHGKALLHSLEMPELEIGQRIMSAWSQVEYKSIATTASEIEWRRLNKATPEISQLPLTIDDRASITHLDIAASARKHARDGLQLLVVDYLQLLTPTDRRLPREQQVSEASRAMKLLAKDLGIAVVVLAQLNRASESRGDKRPTIADLRESGAVEQDADAVLLLFRDPDDKQSAHRLEVGVGKNRGGPLGRVDLHWDAAHMRVTSSAEWAS